MKFSADSLFRERAGAYYREVQKYTKYMLNDHLLFVLVFALGALLYYYSGWVRQLDPFFPAPLVMALAVAFVLIWSPVYTYIKRPDTVYLLPLENDMQPYMKKAVWASFFAQMYVLVALLAFLMPMYAAVEKQGFGSFFSFLAVILAIKGWNLLCRKQAVYQQEADKRFVDIGVRFVLNAVLLYGLFAAAYPVLALGAAGGIVWLLWMKRQGSRPMKWELLADLEEKRLAAFYRLANLFTDVPHLQGKAKRRAWLDSWLPGPRAGTYAYLLHRTFVRMSEYSGLWLRLTAIGAFIVAFSGLLPVELVASLLFLYLTGFQLLPISVRHHYLIWLQLYPESGTKEKQKAVQLLLLRVMLIQSAVFGLAAFWGSSAADALLVLAATVLFTVSFVYLYAPGRLKRMGNS